MRGLPNLFPTCAHAAPSCASSAVVAGSASLRRGSRLLGEELRCSPFGGAPWSRDAAAEASTCPRFLQTGERRRSGPAPVAPPGACGNPAGSSAETAPRGASRSATEHAQSMDAAARGGTPLPEGAGSADAGRTRSWVDRLNSSSKWLAVAGCGTSLVVLHNRESLWFLVGMLGNSFLSKLLKRLFRHQRPEAAKEKDKGDYGMPSSHAQSLSFLCTYAALACLAAYGTQPLSLAVVSAIVSSCIFFIWLRVYGGLHSHAQVLVGGVIGLVDALLWNKLFDTLLRGIATGWISSSAFDGALLGFFATFSLFALYREIKSRKNGTFGEK